MVLKLNIEKIPLTSSRAQDYGTLNSVYSIETKTNSRKCALLIILFALACSTVAFLLYSTIFSQQPEFSTELKFPASSPTCQSIGCNLYAGKLYSSMNFSVNPCDDFYEHVCGNWNLGMSNLHSQLEYAHQIVEYALWNTSTVASKSKLFHYMSEVYRDFVDFVYKRNKLDFAALLKQLLGDNQLSLFGVVSLTAHNVTNSSKAIDSLSDFVKVWKSWKSNAEMKHNADDAPDTELWMDLFVEASLMRVDTFIKSIQISKYHSSIHIKLDQNEAYLLDDQVDHKLYQKFKELKAQISFFFNIDENRWNSSLNYVLFEVIDFKLELGKIYAEFEINDFSYIYPLTDLLEHNNSLTNFNWTLLLSKFANKTQTSTQFLGNEYVGVETQNIDLLTSITKMISSTPIRVLKNLMALYYMNAFGKLQSFTDWRTFMNKDLDVFLPLYTRLYIDYFDSYSKGWMHVRQEHANEMMQNMKKTFGEALKQEYNWLDEQTRNSALEKVIEMESIISHPDWILNDTALDEVFGFDDSVFSPQRIKGNFASSYFNLLRIVQSGSFRQLNQNDWPERLCNFAFNEIGINCANLNSIVVTHALLSDVSFNLDSPIELKYGHLGITIAHELIHSFDNNGIKYDMDGDKINWWTDYADQQFHNRSQCFVQQYAQHGINGTSTLGDNIADNGGLNLAYRLFEKHLNYSQSHGNVSFQTLPPFLAQYSHEQLFFVATAMHYCFHRNYSSTDTAHSPPKYRVNIPLQNSNKFAQAFNCPVGSNMNPEHKCVLW